MARQWIIGRGEQCDLVVNHPSVSTRHCRLLETGSGFLVEDLKSTNGTFVEGRLAEKPIHVEPGSCILLGLDIPMPWPKEIKQNCARQKPGIRKNASKLTGENQSILFGRDDECDHVLPSPQVSRKHARLHRKSNALVLQDLGSTNGTFLNRTRISKPTPVKPGDEIGIGVYSFKVEDGRLEKSGNPGSLVLEARDITIEVPACRLLEDVSLTILPSEFVGLMGPSGAGKTTLMNALNGYCHPSSGNVLFNGMDLYSNYARFSHFIGYVPQDDIIHRDLTVGEALYFTAKLRLPDDFSEEEIGDRIRAVLGQLGLGGKENVQIGSPEKKGISGGQRKRVNLAMELLTDPVFLFLDEPTSGLSSEDALRVMKVLRGLAHGGKSILLTIHQPSLEVFRLMDNLVLVSKDEAGPEPGRLVYYGPAYPEAVHFFNPADRAPEGLEPSPDKVLRGLAENGKTEFWVRKYRDSSFFRTFVTDRASNGNSEPGLLPDRSFSRSSVFNQTLTLIRRSLRIKIRDVWNTAILLVQAPIVAFLVVMVFGEQVRDEESLKNWSLAGSGAVTLFMMSLAALWFGCSNSVREIVGERPIYHRERMVNLRIRSYVASKFAILGALCFFQCLVLVGVVAWGCELKGPKPLLFGILFLASLVGVSIGLMISAVSKTSEVAIAVLPLVLIPMVILGGVMQPIYQMNRLVRFGADLMPSRWVFEGAMALESGCRPDFPVLDLVGQETDQKDDMAEKYFPRAVDRRPAFVAFAILGMMLAGSILAVLVILRMRDVH